MTQRKKEVGMFVCAFMCVCTCVHEHEHVHACVCVVSNLTSLHLWNGEMTVIPKSADLE